MNPQTPGNSTQPNIPAAGPTSPAPAPASAPALNPNALSIDDMSRLLSAVGGRKVTVEQIQADIDAGAPCPDGRINLVHYAAWLLQNLAGDVGG